VFWYVNEYIDYSVPWGGTIVRKITIIFQGILPVVLPEQWYGRKASTQTGYRASLNSPQNKHKHFNFQTFAAGYKPVPSFHHPARHAAKMPAISLRINTQFVVSRLVGADF